jgi:hypothetical protein
LHHATRRSACTPPTPTSPPTRTAEAHLAAYNAAFEELGLNWSWDAADLRAACRAAARKGVRAYLETRAGPPAARLRADFLVNAIEAAKYRCRPPRGAHENRRHRGRRHRRPRGWPAGRAGETSTFLVRGANLEALRRDGLRLTLADGSRATRVPTSAPPMTTTMPGRRTW